MPTSDPECPFCQIGRREGSGAREVYRDDDVIAFFPDEPATLGHTMVIPRSHIPNIWSLGEVTAGHLARATLRLSTAINSALEPKGLNIIQSNGEVATQTVFHLHVHVVPRWENDAMGPIWPEVTNYSEQQIDEVLKRVREECRRLKRP